MIKITSSNPNYLAKVVSLPSLEKHPNADKLQVVKIDFNTVITGMDAKEGDLYVYFPLECSINKDFLSYTNSFENKELNQDVEKRGYFNKHGRVRAVRLRSVPSEGYIVPISIIEEWYNITKNKNLELKNFVGQEFDTIEDVILCEKYIPKNLQQKSQGSGKQGKTKKKKESKIIPDIFKFHVDTEQLKKNVHKISPNDTISTSYKLHGTSVILSYLPCRRTLTILDRIAKFFGVNVQETKNDYIFSSRRVVKNDYDSNNKEHFYSDDIWTKTGEKYKESIREGISIYGEIVGQLENGSWIQKDYDYGVSPKHSELFVYRITFTNENGETFEFNRKQMEEYCEKYNLKIVPLFYYGKAKDLYPELNIEEHWHENFLNNLIRDYTEKDCYMCRNKVPEEGIVIVKESLFSFDAFKLKSFRFFERETKELDKGEANIEDEG